jgi:transcriptional regulator with XRE-family HTH domain
MSEQLNLIAIGDNIRNLRTQRGMTQLDVVLALEISYTHYARIEQGVRGMSLKMLYALMKFFDVDANTILGIKEVDSYGR